MNNCNINGESEQFTSTLQELTVYANHSFNDVTFQCVGNAGICFDTLTLYCTQNTAI